jgi:tellurite resistance protein
MARHSHVYLQELFGITKKISREEAAKNGKAMLICAGADGLSKKELDYAINLFKAYGTPDDLLEEYESFDYKKAKLEDYLAPGGTAPPRVILYHAIKISRADGVYSKEERAATRKAAKLLGVEVSAVSAIEGLVEVEEATNRTRMALLYP